ncbi:MAG: RES family NAD+ phosphorylase [Pseudomonadota bacterium]
MIVWRISDHNDLEGKGGLFFSGRWNFKGEAIVYCADHPSTAMLEILVNTDLHFLPDTYQLLKIEIPDEAIEQVGELPKNWHHDPGITQSIWRTFCAESENAVLAVPCVIVPHAWNYLINPKLVDQSGISIVGNSKHPYDERFQLEL